MHKLFEKIFYLYEVINSLGEEIVYSKDIGEEKTSIFIHKGYHSYGSFNRLGGVSWKNIKRIQIVKCTIPVGAKYYVQSDEDFESSEIVSDTIIIHAPTI